MQMLAGLQSNGQMSPAASKDGVRRLLPAGDQDWIGRGAGRAQTGKAVERDDWEDDAEGFPQGRGRICVELIVYLTIVGL
jgi:hypothetical protein